MPPDGLWVIAAESDGDRYNGHYFDSRGIVRLYAMTFDGACGRCCGRRRTSRRWSSPAVHRRGAGRRLSDPRSMGEPGARPARLGHRLRPHLRAPGLSSPVSSRRRGALLDSVQGAVAGGVVGLVVLPAAPYDGRPGAGQHTNGVRVAHAAGAGAAVDVGGPGGGPAGGGGGGGQGPGPVWGGVFGGGGRPG